MIWCGAWLKAISKQKPMTERRAPNSTIWRSCSIRVPDRPPADPRAAVLQAWSRAFSQCVAWVRTSAGSPRKARVPGVTSAGSSTRREPGKRLRIPWR
ncbi:MAG: hypothetical protein ACK559_22005, partial [bacterium]